MSNQKESRDAKSVALAEPILNEDLHGISGGSRHPNRAEGFATVDVKSKPQPNELRDIIAIL